MNELEQRERIVAAARAWLRTPFHDDARVLGVGVDCAQFVAAVYIESGATPYFETPRYSAQWMLHHAEERLAEFVMRFGKEIAEERADKGDLVLFKLGRAYAHAAIVLEWRDKSAQRIIHAHKLSGMVIETRPFDADLRGRATRFFSLWG